MSSDVKSLCCAALHSKRLFSLMWTDPGTAPGAGHPAEGGPSDEKQVFRWDFVHCLDLFPPRPPSLAALPSLFVSLASITSPPFLPHDPKALDELLLFNDHPPSTTYLTVWQSNALLFADFWFLPQSETCVYARNNHIMDHVWLIVGCRSFQWLHFSSSFLIVSPSTSPCFTRLKLCAQIVKTKYTSQLKNEQWIFSDRFFTLLLIVIFMVCIFCI